MRTFNNLKINIDTKQLSSEQLKELLNEREKSILSVDQLREKLIKGEASVLNPKANSMVYMYIANETKCPMSKVQFYDSTGELICTYPWNGNHEIYGVIRNTNGKLENAYRVLSSKNFPYNYTDISDLQVTTTPNGKIVLRQNEYVIQPPLKSEYKWRGLVLSDGKEYHYQFGAIEIDNYEGTKLSNESISNRDENWANLMENEGDKFMEYCEGNSFVI